MKHELLDIVTRARAVKMITPEALLCHAFTSGNRYYDQFAQLLHAGPVTLKPLESGHDVPRVTYLGSTASGLYCIWIEEPNGEGWLPANHSAVEAYHVPLTAVDLDDVETLFRFAICDDQFGRDVWSQVNRVKDADQVLSKVLGDLLQVNIGVAQSAVAAHTKGTWSRPPASAVPEITQEARALLRVRAHPRAQILTTGWFSASESWVASAYGGTAIVIGQEISFSGPGFISESGVTFEPGDLPPGVISVRLKTKQIQLDIILCSIVSVG
jgi:hypothetical protein